MDAAAMVELALRWPRVPPQRVCEAQAPMTDNRVLIRAQRVEKMYLTTDGCAEVARRRGDPSQRVVYLEHVQAKYGGAFLLSEHDIFWMFLFS
ncbi:unnamed protein product [Protopolystoma xenopodis]|uniref:Uncharacterized protein n=1 Tax=Protopolystoma xenopodis TaxID=117903 RepID=A0A448XK43_9PLAT|nr:unnamed protein product [Protopolystoma xenopodis]